MVSPDVFDEKVSSSMFNGFSLLPVTGFRTGPASRGRHRHVEVIVLRIWAFVAMAGAVVLFTGGGADLARAAAVVAALGAAAAQLTALVPAAHPGTPR
ncbi:hypothetical protein [Nocardia sp. NPDC051570]|uniref:hypothetical protein n=1 Tax=Nocardia sp. NPDC051570 TaxID=3364324 RepID=UPI00378E1D8B